MNWSFLAHSSLKALAQHKGRSLLTALSIIVGITTVISVLAIGQGAAHKIQSKIASVGENFLLISPGNFIAARKSGRFNIRSHPLTMDDLQKIRQTVPHIKHLSPVARLTIPKNVTYKNKSVQSCYVVACDPNHKKISSFSMKYGTFFSPAHNNTNSPVIVLGKKMSTELFGNKNPINETVTLKGLPFLVIGVVDDLENLNSFQDRNLNVYVPYIFGMRKLEKKSPHTISGTIAISVTHDKHIKQVERMMRRVLRESHHLRKGQADDFTIWSQQAMAQAAETSSQILSIFLLIIASFSLLVGGIGVMNIMLVSVTERTKEIGIRCALGATPASIRTQFLIESIILCASGGIIGVLLGSIIPITVSFFTGWQTIITWNTILLTLGSTSCIGLFFGYYPAQKAAHMNVVEALIDR